MTKNDQPKRPAPPTHRLAFARRLEAARVAAGYETMRDFAKALGVEEARYGRWARAEVEPDILNLSKIAKVTGVSLDTLVSGDKRNAA